MSKNAGRTIVSILEGMWPLEPKLAVPIPCPSRGLSRALLVSMSRLLTGCEMRLLVRPKSLSVFCSPDSSLEESLSWRNSLANRDCPDCRRRGRMRLEWRMSGMAVVVKYTVELMNTGERFGEREDTDTGRTPKLSSAGDTRLTADGFLLSFDFCSVFGGVTSTDSLDFPKFSLGRGAAGT